MDNYIRFRENQRNVTRGVSFYTERRRFEVDMERDETKIVTLDFNDMLASGETITDVTVSKTSGITAAVSTTSNICTLTLSALSRLGDVTLTVTRSTGAIFKVFLRASSSECIIRDDYRIWSYA